MDGDGRHDGIESFPPVSSTGYGEIAMDRKKASDFPQELLDLFDDYVHGRMGRRAFFAGAQKFAIGGLTATALFDMLKPNYAWAIQVPPDDKRIKAEYVTVP